jgi:hypothetical protein
MKSVALSVYHTFTPPHVLMTSFVIKHGDGFTFRVVPFDAVRMRTSLTRSVGG